MRCNPDSDQSISDEEEFERALPGNCFSFGEDVENRGGQKLPSKVDTLRGTDELKYGKKHSSSKKQMRISLDLEDEVEMPVSEDESDFLHPTKREFTLCSDEEIVFDDDDDNKLTNTPSTSRARNFESINFDVGNQKQDEAQWYAINQETEALIRLHENASCSTSTSAYSKSKKLGNRSKPKLSFRFQTHKGVSSGPPILSNIKFSKDESNVVNKVHDLMEHNIFEHPTHERYDDPQEEQIDQFEMCKFPNELESHERNNYTEHSMAELLDGLHDNTDLLRENPELDCVARERTRQLVNISSSRVGESVDDEDPLEHIGSESSSTDEENGQHLKVAISEYKGQTMSDRFQDALGAACLNDEETFIAAPKTSFVGLFGKLQKVLETEKETDAGFLKKLQSGISPIDGTSCIDVKIISRYLDAKLTVCHCHFSKNRESLECTEIPQAREANGMDVTVVFSSRLCDDVELEVGNSIRIYSPWKEVPAMSNDKVVILSSYFSQISM